METNEPLPAAAVEANIGAPIEKNSDEANVREALVQLKKQREAEGRTGPMATHEVAEPVKVEWHDKREGDISLKQATEATQYQKKVEDGQRMARQFGAEITAAEGYAISDNAAAIGKKPSELPFDKLGTANDAGEVFQPIDDMERKVWDREDTGNVREVTRALSNYRQVQAAAAADQVAQLEQAARQHEYDRLRGTAEAGQEPVQADLNLPVAGQEAQQAQPQQPAVDPLARERAALAEQYKWAEANARYAQLSADERDAFDAVQKWDRWSQGQPELQDSAKFAALQQRVALGDVAATKRMQEYQKAFQNRKAWNDRFTQLNTNRVTRQMQMQQEAQRQVTAQYDKAKEVVDGQFRDWLQKEHPAWATGRGYERLKEAANRYVREDLGLTPDEVRRHWSETGYLRNLASQKSIALASMQKLSQNRARDLAAHRVSAPPPVTPGFAGPISRQAEELRADIQALQNEVANAKGERAALRAATALHKARREAGLV